MEGGSLTICSSDDVVQSAQQQAQVANADQLSIVPVVNGTTRGTLFTTSTLDAFKVDITGDFQKGEEDATLWSGADLIQTISKSGSTWGFPAGTEFWWANRTTTATFTAWAPATVADNYDSDGTSYTVENAIDANANSIIIEPIISGI